jgi:16S rRNA (cytidine1402-2'-O)-methyltransferase
MTPEFKIEPGTLYIVSTPIGNLQDITLRALDVLSQVDLIAAEDTRKSSILLNHYNIRTPLKSYHSYNQVKATAQIVTLLKTGTSVAVICDAGTPGISDPAFRLVRDAIEADIRIEAIPGVTAFVPALNVSGVGSDRFVFEGFLPVKKGRQKKLAELANEPRTILIYESPRRVVKTLHDLDKFLGDRRIALVREITKKFEQVERGLISEIIQRIEKIPLKGEFVFVIEGSHGMKKNKQAQHEICDLAKNR